MRYELTPEFEKKQTIMRSYGGSLSDALLLLKRIEALRPEDLHARPAELTVSEYAGGRLLIGLQNTEFLCERNGSEPDLLRLLDIAQYVEIPMFSHGLPHKDPNRRDEINPAINPNINPRLNNDLNPRIHVDLNPNVNTDLNPRINPDLNPVRNLALNYKVEPEINPRMNDRINPNINKFINPKLNRLFDGLFVYDLDNTHTAFTVRADDRVTLFFDMENEFASIGVRNESGGHTLFDLNFEWTGFTVPDGQGGFVRFDLEAEWTGYLV